MEETRQPFEITWKLLSPQTYQTALTPTFKPESRNKEESSSDERPNNPGRTSKSQHQEDQQSNDRSSVGSSEEGANSTEAFPTLSILATRLLLNNVNSCVFVTKPLKTQQVGLNRHLGLSTSGCPPPDSVPQLQTLLSSQSLPHPSGVDGARSV
ncbi:hypothetical protein TNIN_215401 [Trichonephila inaurata madagascariensis]|uniref:Uncharacterized protein n=1 Tax=Trichonephila inaurata madagascariensis TaxID=2747483 RepID=A0A8X6J5A0_9ARAC|nr:hypothetical protein TNIN_215401 [Trichonephila inaurata madagascariensis]